MSSDDVKNNCALIYPEDLLMEAFGTTLVSKKDRMAYFEKIQSTWTYSVPVPPLHSFVLGKTMRDYGYAMNFDWAWHNHDGSLMIITAEPDTASVVKLVISELAL